MLRPLNPAFQITAERAVDVRHSVLEGAAQHSLVLGTDASPWNNANIRTGADAQLALDEVARIANELWPRFEKLLGCALGELGLRPPDTIERSGELLTLLRDVRRLRENYQPALFEANPGDLAQKLQPASRGSGSRLWAFLTNSGYRVARKRLRAMRSTPAPAPVLLADARLAQEVLRRWREFGSATEIPRDFAKCGELASALTALRGALDRLNGVVQNGPLHSWPIGDAASQIRALADKYAPRWGRNHMFWGEALAKQGKAAEAKAQFTAAAGMDLTAAERSRLNQLLDRPA